MFKKEKANKLIIGLLLISFSSMGFANTVDNSTQEQEEPRRNTDKAFCASADINDSLREEVKLRLKEFKEQTKGLKETIKTSKESYLAIVTSEESVIADADAALLDLNQKISEFQLMKMGFYNQVSYELVPVDQRAEVLKCLLKKKKKRRPKRRS